MKTFKDVDGKEWTLALDLATAKRLRDQSLDLVDDDSRTRIVEDPFAVLDVAWALLKPEAEARNLDFDAFAAVLTGCFVAFMDAFVGELATFCRSLGKTTDAAILGAVLKAERKAEETATRKLAEPKVDDLIKTELAKAEATVDEEIEKFRTSGDSSTKSPGPSESTPDP